MISPKPAVFGTHDQGTLAQLRDVASRAESAALMADGHKGYVMPIGGVAAYRDKVSQYAYAGRECVARKVVGILGGQELELIHNHHNFAWRETHGGEDLIVVRKGATPAFPGSRVLSEAAWATMP